MISQETLTLDWINAVSRRNRNADRILIEKVVRALLLLEGLVECGLNFTLKGGTALMLLQNSTRRLSIDIDIILPKRIELESHFSVFIKEKNFIRFEAQNRKSTSSVDKMHYKFFYRPIYKTNQTEEYVLLDILIEKVLYENTLSIDIDSPFVQQEKAPVKVAVPDLEGILGDKLTAFAPTTTGIPYERNGHSQAMEIIKQLYDIGNLFDGIRDLSILKKTFEQFSLKELSYRKLAKEPRIVLQDIFNTAMCISTRGRAGKGDFLALQNGIRQIRAYIFSESYQIEKAIVHASKAAYLSKLIELNKDHIVRFENALQVKEWIIEQPSFTRLNRLKRSNPEAFFYWYNILNLT